MDTITIHLQNSTSASDKLYQRPTACRAPGHKKGCSSVLADTRCRLDTQRKDLKSRDTIQPLPAHPKRQPENWEEQVLTCPCFCLFEKHYFSFSVWFLFLLIWVRVLGSCVLWFRKCSSLMPALDGRDFLVPLRLNLVMWLCVLIGCQEAGCKQSLETCLHHGSGSFCTSSMAMRSGCLFIQKGWKTPGADLDATHILKSWRAWITWKPANLQMLLWD